MFGEPLCTKAYKEEHLVLWPWQFRFHHWCGWEQPWIINIDMELPQLKPWDIFGKKEVCSCTPSLHYYHTKLNKSNHNKRDLNPCALNSWLLCCELNTQSSAYLFCYFFFRNLEILSRLCSSIASRSNLQIWWYRSQRWNPSLTWTSPWPSNCCKDWSSFFICWPLENNDKYVQIPTF